MYHNLPVAINLYKNLWKILVESYQIFNILDENEIADRSISTRISIDDKVADR